LPPDDLIAPDMILHYGVGPGMFFWIFQTGARSGAVMACWRESIVFRICKEDLATSLELSVLSPPPTSSILASSTVDEPQKWTLNPYEWL
jgi:hypothetical protein